MTLEHHPTIENDNFHERFPHLKERKLTKEQQEKFLILHAHNEKQEERDRLTHDQILEQLYATIPNDKEKISIDHEDANHKSHIKADGVLYNVDPSKSLATNIIDFIPVIGSTKMIIEGIRGRQFGTNHEITGLGRVLHTGSGALFLVLDVTGVGAIASSLGKGIFKAGVFKVGERIALKELELVAEKAALEEVGKIAAHGLIKKELKTLAVRGEIRHEKEKKISESTT